MKINGSHTFDVSKERLWTMIHNPASLMSVIPGCQNIEQISPTEYRGRIQMKLPAIVGDYQTWVKLTEFNKPDHCTFEGEVTGSPGVIKGTASFRLTEVEGQTTLAYEGQGLITGPLARLSDRFAEGLAKTLIGQGLARLSQELEQTSGTEPDHSTRDVAQ